MNRAGDRPDVSIIIPVLDKLEFTQQCLDRIWRNTATVAYEIVIVDDEPRTDGTPKPAAPTRASWSRRWSLHTPCTNLGFAKANNAGASPRAEPLRAVPQQRHARHAWLADGDGPRRSNRTGPSASSASSSCFPYTNNIHHTGIIFAAGRRPQHLYPHLDGSLPHVNESVSTRRSPVRACSSRGTLFDECGRFDEGYRNGYEDIDLCLQVDRRGRTVVCCTSALHLPLRPDLEGRTADDDSNAARMLGVGAGSRSNTTSTSRATGEDSAPSRPRRAPVTRASRGRLHLLADDLRRRQRADLGQRRIDPLARAPGASRSSPTARRRCRRPARGARQLLETRRERARAGGIQIKWSHYWPQHLNLELNGRLNLELFVINYLFAQPGRNRGTTGCSASGRTATDKLPLSTFCQDVLGKSACRTTGQVVRPGYSPEVLDVAAPARRARRFRLLTVTNSHDLERYNTLAAARRRIGRRSAPRRRRARRSRTTAPRRATGRFAICRRAGHGARSSTSPSSQHKRELIELYKSCDAFVSAHRGEGYGMKILDALACGLPVITPLFGGPDRLLHADNSLPVAFSLVPIGDCLDTRVPADHQRPAVGRTRRRASLAHADAPGLRRPGRGRRLVRGRAADVAIVSPGTRRRPLLDVVDGGCAQRTQTPSGRGACRPPAERSPYWMGCRVSVIVPTFNRSAKLRRCLEALARQSILPQEFEVIVVDDGSTDGTREALEASPLSVRARVAAGERGPGTARNIGLAQAVANWCSSSATTSIADERLLEAHLEAHADQPDPATAVLGHIDWPPTSPNVGDGLRVRRRDAAVRLHVHPRCPALDIGSSTRATSR